MMVVDWSYGILRAVNNSARWPDNEEYQNNVKIVNELKISKAR